MESNAWDLPEIRALIVPYLSPASLHACVLVSKVWHDFFIRLLWATFHFGPPRKTSTTSSSDEPQLPERATIEKHAHLIQNLVVFDLTPTFRLDLFRGTPLTSLKELHLSPSISSNTTNTSHLDWIFRQNPGLQVVEYNGTRSKSQWSQRNTLEQQQQEQQEQEKEKEEVLVLLDSCREIVDLTMRYVEFKEEYWEGFRRLCATKLKRLVFYRGRGLEDAKWDGIPMPHLQELEILSADGFVMVPNPRMIFQCPNLRTLRWSDNRGQDPDPYSFHQILASCPRLDALDVQGMALPDDDIATFLTRMTHPAREIILPTTKFPFEEGPRFIGFGLKAFEALARQHLTEQLVVLDIGPTSGFVTSGMVLKVLHSCTRLREIGACRVSGRDICEQAQVEGRWACHGLEVFNVRVVFELPDEQLVQTQEGVFRQLSGLTRLRVLNVGTRTTTTIQQQMDSLFSTVPNAEAEAESSLQFKLEYGLAQLAGLKRLEILSVVGGVPQKLAREDVEWMRRWWRGLKIVKGQLYPEKKVNVAIWNVLTIRARWREGQEEEAKDEERFLGLLDELGFRSTAAAAMT
ncbi:hypothetical protein KI688_004726 [Linnemannia hyalina]|uniref:F-box domain-containing protein n=1 Tax=Linnemannia hyalina TaxID=64524 RepID=A0A9P7XL84_9FUNG|nr:hypothetical protein KI688_004726 [Linnemannia hyalina]